MELNKHYAEAVKTVKVLNKKGAGLWASLVLFACTLQGENPRQPEKGDIKPQFKLAETQASDEFKVKMGENSTYRVAKGVIAEAVLLGVDLLDSNGKPKGKTEVEETLKDMREGKSPFDKFKQAIANAGKQVEKLDASQRLLATALIQELVKKASEGLKLAA